MPRIFWASSTEVAKTNTAREESVSSPAVTEVHQQSPRHIAKSVLAVMGLGATRGQQITVRAAGPDAAEAVTTLIGILAEATPVGG